MSRENRNSISFLKATSMVKQCFKDDCNINEIIRRNPYQLAESVAKANTGIYDDISAVDYQTALNTLIKADAMFQEQPSEIRNKFLNDPYRFFEFVNDKSNAQELMDMGLAEGIDSYDVEAEISAIRAAVEAPPPTPPDAKPKA